MVAPRRYREFSRTSIPGSKAELVADTSVLISERRVVHRIHSATSNAYKDVEITGNPVYDTTAILAARKAVMDHDGIDRGVRAAPKPERRQLTPAEMLASCGYCGGRGYVVDDWGDESVCRCRR